MYPAAGVSRRQITSPRLVANRCCCVRWTFAAVDDLNLRGSASASASYDAAFPLAGRIANCHLSVRLSVTNRCYIKTTERIIAQPTPSRGSLIVSFCDTKDLG